MAPDSTAGPVLGSAVADDDVLAVLRGWLPAQRWYPVKGSGGDLARVAVVPLVDPLGEAVVGLHLFGLPAGGVLQVPVVLRAADAERPTGPAHVGTVARPGGALVVLDGCQDPAFLRAWLAAAHHDVPVPDVDLAAPGAVRGLGGEQSNTSVLLPTLPTPAILKVFRAVSPGANPDVEVPLALLLARTPTIGLSEDSTKRRKRSVCCSGSGHRPQVRDSHEVPLGLAHERNICSPPPTSPNTTERPPTRAASSRMDRLRPRTSLVGTSGHESFSTLPALVIQ